MTGKTKLVFQENNNLIIKVKIKVRVGKQNLIIPVTQFVFNFILNLALQFDMQAGKDKVS